MAYLERLKKETEALEKSIMELVVFSEGTIGLSEIWYMSGPQRELFAKTFTNYMKQKAGKTVTEDL